MKNKIIIIGSGGHARSCIEIINQSKKYRVAGIVTKEKTVLNKINNIPIVGSDKDLVKLRKKFKYCFIGVGQLKNYNLKQRLYNKLKKLNFIIPKIVSNFSVVSKNAKIGEGTIIMNNVFINSHSEIGSNCIINNGSIIEHDVCIAANTHISTGVIVNGESKIETNSFIGSGSIIVNNITIRKNSFIKAGSIIKRSN